MGNSAGKKRTTANAQSNKRSVANAPSNNNHTVALTSSSLNNMTVEFPKEIEEDLERRKIESLKALAGGGKRKQAKSNSLLSDPAADVYQQMKNLDMPAVIVPKPWSEVDEILSKHKDSLKKYVPDKATVALVPSNSVEDLEEEDAETIEWDILDEDEDGDEITSRPVVIVKSSAENFRPQDMSAKKIQALEKSISFSTIHTIKEIESGAIKPEKIGTILKPRNYNDKSSREVAVTFTKSNSSSAIEGFTPRKVKVNPNLLARVQAFS